MDVVKPYKQCAIYGAGNFGAQMFEGLSNIGALPIAFFLDKNAKEGDVYCGVPSILPNAEGCSQEDKEQTLVFNSLVLNPNYRSESNEMLTTCGFLNRAPQSLLTYALMCRQCVIDPSALSENIRFLFEKMEDDHSKSIFLSHLKAHFTHQFEDALQSEGMIQYFDVNVPFAKGYSHLVEVGAETGTTFLQVVDMHPVHTYIGFEPNEKQFPSLVNAVGSAKNKYTNAMLYPCATGSTPAFCRFSQKGTSSAIDARGEQEVQILRMDDVLHSSQITMIKMDIEGAEMDALMGAKELITTQKPDLAICVYHKTDDLWELTNLLLSYVPEYKLYLRCHDRFTQETVLYLTT